MGTVHDVGHEGYLNEDELKMIQEKGYPIAFKLAIGAVFHPFHHVKTLLQLGHEPYPLSLGKKYWVFGPQSYMLPSGFKYVKNIYSERGISGLYTGAFSSLWGNVTGSAVSIAAIIYLDRHHPNVGGRLENEGKSERQLSDSKSFRRFFRQTVRESIARIAGTVVSRPFQVICIRQIAQAVGDQNKYTSLVASFCLINNEEGLKGLFAGLVPQLMFEVGTIVLINSTIFLVERALVTVEGEQDECVQMDEQVEEVGVLTPVQTVRKASQMLVPFFIGAFIYPLRVVSTVMAINGSGLPLSMLPYAPDFGSWRDCYDYLQREKQLKRGAQLFLRHYPGPVTVGVADGQFYASLKKFIL